MPTMTSAQLSTLAGEEYSEIFQRREKDFSDKRSKDSNISELLVGIKILLYKQAGVLLERERGSGVGLGQGQSVKRTSLSFSARERERERKREGRSIGWHQAAPESLHFYGSAGRMWPLPLPSSKEANANLEDGEKLCFLMLITTDEVVILFFGMGFASSQVCVHDQLFSYALSIFFFSFSQRI